MNKKDLAILSKDSFFGALDAQGLAVTFAEVRLRTGLSEVLPSDVDIASKFSRNVPLNAPIVSAAMDRVTEAPMAIAMAKLGGLGIIHRGMSSADQIKMVGTVKNHLHGFITNPICVKSTDTVEDVLIMQEEKGYSFHSFPVIDGDGKVVGILTSNDFEFCGDRAQPVEAIMTRDIIHLPVGTNVDQAYEKMQEQKIKVLPILQNDGTLEGLYTFSDAKRIKTGSADIFNLDSEGRLRVGVAVGTSIESIEAVEKMFAKGLDVVVVDTAHGDSKPVFDMVCLLKEKLPELDVVAGNVSEPESALRLAQAGVDGIKVGQGPGSICTTRVVAGIGCPQVTAVYSCAKALRGMDVPVCADGGLEYPGDIPIAIGVGADCVMMGSMLAGTKESPGKIIFRDGRQWKEYRGMGSLGAMQKNSSSRERYLQKDHGNDPQKLFPEGVEGLTPFKGPVDPVVFQYCEGLRRGMGYVGAASIEELQSKADFRRNTSTGSTESHPHGVVITKQAPNYKG